MFSASRQFSDFSDAGLARALEEVRKARFFAGVVCRLRKSRAAPSGGPV